MIQAERASGAARTPWLILALLSALATAAYWPVLAGSYILDDWPTLAGLADVRDGDAARFGRYVVEGYMAGEHKSPYRGFAIEFAQHREYTHGDDTRHLDWKVLGRTDRYYIKQYEQETNYVANILLDQLS